MFSLGGGSEYNLSSDNVHYSDSELSSNDKSVKLELDANLPDYIQQNPNIGVIPAGKKNYHNLAYDTNVKFVVDAVITKM